jgi:hypothetical protein
MIESKYIRSLIYLTEKSITSIALEAGVDPTNLSRFLKGHSTVSDEKMEKVLEHLGVDPVTGTLKPGIHRWKVNPSRSKSIKFEFEDLIPDLVPGGGKIIILALNKDDYRWSAIVGNNGTRIIMDSALMVFQIADGEPQPKFALLEAFLPEWKWKESYRIITSADLKRLIGDVTLTPSEFDEILGLKDENRGNIQVNELWPEETIASEDTLETEYDRGWTWEAVVRRAKESGLKPEEVAKRLGLSE